MHVSPHALPARHVRQHCLERAPISDESTRTSTEVFDSVSFRVSIVSDSPCNTVGGGGSRISGGNSRRRCGFAVTGATGAGAVGAARPRQPAASSENVRTHIDAQRTA